MRQARTTAPLHPMPLVVISASAAQDPAQLTPFFPPGWPVELMPQVHRELQADLVGLVSNGRHVIAERSGHYVHQSQPELVVEAIHQVANAVWDQETWEPAATPDGLRSGRLTPGSPVASPTP
jgi:hypothetical protein